MIIPLLALALVQAEAPPTDAAAPAPAQGPVATSAPSATGVSAAADSDIPKGAPTDDYGLVAWCRGALTGHMALYKLVQPELRSIERPGEVAADRKEDQEQMQAGRDYLALYTRAMAAAEKASVTPIHDRGERVEGQGEAIWTAASEAPPRTRMWSWLMWDLPGRCEVAAKRLEARSGLLGAALRDSAAEPSPAPSAPQSIDDALQPGAAATPPATDAPAPASPASSAEPALRGPQ